MWQDVNNHAMAGTHKAIDLIIDNGGEIEVTSTHHQMMIPGPMGIECCIANQATSFKSADPQKKPPRHDTEVVFYEKKDGGSILCFQPHPEYNHKGTRLYFFDLIDHFFL